MNRLKIKDRKLYFNLVIGCGEDEELHAGFCEVTETKITRRFIYLYNKTKNKGVISFQSKFKDLTKEEKLILLEYLKLQVENE